MECRLCLKIGASVLIFGEFQVLPIRIWDCCGIMITENDGLPDKICLACESKLRSFFKFKQTCEQSDKFLKEKHIRAPKIKIEIEIPEESRQLDNVNGLHEIFIKSENDISMWHSDESSLKGNPQDHVPKIKMERRKAQNTFDSPRSILRNYLEGKKVKIPKKDCRICGKVYKSKYLGTHIKNVHNKNMHNMSDRSGQYYECDVCHKTFTKKEYISLHISRHFNLIKKHPCGQCDSKFDSASKLRKHVDIVHLKIKRYECEICGKLSGSSNTHVQHLQIHKTDCDYICDYCGKGYRHRNSIMCHIKIHQGIKPYKCSYCEKSFSLSSTLKSHIFQHTGENPFSCHLCERRFKQRCNLKSHLKHFHKIPNNYK